MCYKITCCHHCQERHPLCHANCRQYREERVELDKRKMQRILLDDEVERYKRQKLNKIKR